MSAEGTIRLERVSKYADRLRAYRLLIDGDEVVRIKNGPIASYSVQPGRHDVSLKIDWCSSPAVKVDVVSGETVRLAAGPRANALTVLRHGTIGRRKYLRLAMIEPA